MEHGVIADKIRALCEAGIPAEDALAAGLWKAREWLGLRGIEEGAQADVVVYAAAPRVNLDTLQFLQRTVLRGRVGG